MRVSVGRWVPTLNLNPTSNLAMRKNRHTIHFLSPKLLAKRIGEDVIRANGRTDIVVTDLGTMTRLNENVRCFKVQLPRGEDPGFYSDMVEMCQSKRSGLLVTLRSWEKVGEDLRLVEDYGYESLKTNVGLTDEDFSSENTAYNF